MTYQADHIRDILDRSIGMIAFVNETIARKDGRVELSESAAFGLHWVLTIVEKTLENAKSKS